MVGKASANLDLSIIVLLYNANPVKLERTIRSIIDQQSLNFEIILTDDGSQVNPNDMISSIFDKYHYTNYTVNINDQNVGTVKNILSALKLAKGKYIYLISPGDMIFDSTTMKDFFEFAENNQSLVCFGDYLNYNYDGSNINTIEGIPFPPRPYIYEPPYTFFESKVYALLSGNILGPTFFREKNYAIKYFTLTSQSAKYAEDNTSIVFSLADNIPIQHYKRNICWYELGTGISTNGSSKWQELINQDFTNTYTLAKQTHPRDRIIDAAYIKRTKSQSKNKFICLLWLFIKHPFIFLTRAKFNKTPPVYIKCNDEQFQILKEKLNHETAQFKDQ